MEWQDDRKQHLDTWILIEPLDAYTTDEKRRIVEKLIVVDKYADYFMAMSAYEELHQQKPNREMYVVHTVNEEIKIKVVFRRVMDYRQRVIRQG